MKIDYPLVLDGGLSNELEKAGCDLKHKLWTAKLLQDEGEAIIQTHLTYLKAGAKCITTSTYQAAVPGLKEMGYDEKESEKLILKSVDLAAEAIRRFLVMDNTETDLLIAASIGPYGAFLANGSEYVGNYGVPDEQLTRFHQRRIEILDNSKADLLACETIPSFQEAKVLASLLQKTQKPSWVSFSCKDEMHINDGTPIAECAEYLAGHEKIFALGINCTAPGNISGLVRILKEHAATKRIVVYPNSGEIYNSDSKTWFNLEDPHHFDEMTKEWLHLGADIVGGCCRIGPEHIEKISGTILEFNRGRTPSASE